VVGDLYGLGDEVCGIVCGTKATDSIISIWNKTAQDDDAKYKIRYNTRVLIALPARPRVFVLWPRSRKCRRCAVFSFRHMIQRVLNMPSGSGIEYRFHEAALKRQRPGTHATNDPEPPA